MKTPVEQAIEALESSIGAHKIALADADVKGLTRTWAEEALKSCSAALASLKSIKSRLTVDDAMQCVRDWEEYDTRIEHGSAGENEYIDIAGFYLFFSDLQKRLTQSAKP